MLPVRVLPFRGRQLSRNEKRPPWGQGDLCVGQGRGIGGGKRPCLLSREDNTALLQLFPAHARPVH
jgi:hypothetical protein